MAPGFNIMSTVLNGQYQSYSGTSMATPHVSGAAALLLGAEPNLTYQQIKARLISSTDKSRAFKKKLISAGRLNLLNLLTNVSPPGPVTPPDNSWSTDQKVDIQTTHPYADNSKLDWSVEHPGAKFLRVHFKSFDTEAGYDILKLLDEKGVEADSISGKLADNSWSGEVEGSKVTLHFESDSSVNRDGFVIDAFQWTDFNGNTQTESVNISAR
jgi:hypothetical protein